MAQVTLAEVLSRAEPLIAGHANEDLTVEAVGLVFVDGSVRQLINQARSVHRFTVSAMQLQDAVAAHGESPIAVYHSHPQGRAVPSKHDEAMMAEMHHASGVVFPFLIWGRDDGLRVWLWQDDEALEMEF